MVENVTEHQAVCAFKAGVRYRDLYLKFGRTGDISMSKMMEIATRYANGEEEDRIRSGKHKTVADGDGGNTFRAKARPLIAEAASVTNAKFKGKGKAQFTPKKKQFNNPILDQPCPVHTKMDEEGNPIYAKHTTRQCRLLIQGFSEGKPSEKDHEQDEEDKDHEQDPFPQVHATLMIFADVESKSRLKLVNREVNMTTPTNPTFLKWSQTAITFDQSDHPAHVPTPGRQALVVDPVVEGVRLRKVLMDGGSGLNIMYADTLKGMGIPMSKLSKSTCDSMESSTDERPNHSADRVGRRFGSDKNFRKESGVQVVDFGRLSRSAGRPDAHFMARPCYVY
ncbi:hypothetical protein ZWY2020_053003 [Hordeum vulgare]|nr:hypothetical protein ZWY2020_053003 [Hordeum vulgare]